MSDAYQRVSLGTDSSGRPIVVNKRTKAMLDEVASRVGFRPTIVQGSYRGGSGAPASAGTHDGGGVVDLRTWNLSDKQRNAWLAAARKVGFIAWYRTPAQGFDPHMHMVAKGDRDLSSSARSQVVDAAEGRNGLANGGRDTSNKKVPTFNYEAYMEGVLMANVNARLAKLEARVSATTDARAQFAYKTVFNLAKQITLLNTRVKYNTDARAQYAYKAVFELSERLAKLEAAVDKMLEGQK
jgi:hypothetical protein